MVSMRMAIVVVLAGVVVAQPPPAVRVRFETSKGPIVIGVHKDWAPRGAERFLELVESGTHDKEPFVVFGEVERGMEAADALYADYGETAGGGIRAGRQDPVFEGGNA